MKAFNFLLVFFGGAVGAVLRYSISSIAMYSSWPSYILIAAINCLGCFLFGCLSSFIDAESQPYVYTFLLTLPLHITVNICSCLGLCGALLFQSLVQRHPSQRDKDCSFNIDIRLVCFNLLCHRHSVPNITRQ